MSSLHDFRYYFEHRYLPRTYYQYRGVFINRLAKERDILYKLFCLFADHNEVKHNYSENQFRIDSGKLDDKVYYLAFTFPDPEESPLCKYAYLFFDLNFSKAAYFTVERGNEANFTNRERAMKMPYYVCSWTQEGNHENFGTHDIWADDGLGVCFKLFTEGDYAITEEGDGWT